MMWWGQHMSGFGWGGWLIGGLMMLIIWGGIIALVFFSIRAFTSASNRNAPRPNSRGENAMDILNMRYARGEVGKEEYETIRSDLET